VQRLSPAPPARLAIYHDDPCFDFHQHPSWFRPFFAELDRQQIDYVALNARDLLFYDPADCHWIFPLLFNRLNLSADLAAGGSAILHALNFLAHLERAGTRVINGSRAFAFEISKARQLALFAGLDLPAPRSRVIHRAADAPIAAEGLRFPIVVKPNVGGSGAGIVRYESLSELSTAAKAGTIELGLDHVALVQEYVPARGGHITRVETLGGKFLYAINIYPEAELRVESASASSDVIAACEKIAQNAGIDVGSIESMIDDRNGQRVYYDINTLSNFVADASRVIGFNPHKNLVDFLELELRRTKL